jgi:glycine cleavage system H protein
MSSAPENLRYTKEHEWVRDNNDGTYTVGITAHAQELLGDIVFVELPEIGADLEKHGECAVVESVKAASDLYSPLKGKVVAVNEDLEDAPESVNNEPYDAGWVFTMQAETADFNDLLAAKDYLSIVESEL